VEATPLLLQREACSSGFGQSDFRNTCISVIFLPWLAPQSPNSNPPERSNSCFATKPSHVPRGALFVQCLHQYTTRSQRNAAFSCLFVTADALV